MWKSSFLLIRPACLRMFAPTGHKRYWEAFSLPLLLFILRGVKCKYWFILLCRPRKQIANLRGVVLVGKPTVGSAELPAVWKVSFFFPSASLWRTHRYCVSASFNLALALMQLHWFLLYRPGYLVTRLQWAVAHNPLLWLLTLPWSINWITPKWIASLGKKREKKIQKKNQCNWLIIIIVWW